VQTDVQGRSFSLYFHLFWLRGVFLYTDSIDNEGILKYADASAHF